MVQLNPTPTKKWLENFLLNGPYFFEKSNLILVRFFVSVGVWFCFFRFLVRFGTSKRMAEDLYTLKKVKFLGTCFFFDSVFTFVVFSFRSTFVLFCCFLLPKLWRRDFQKLPCGW